MTAADPQTSPTVSPLPHPRPTAADFLAQHRGGGLFTERINQPIGARFAVVAERLGVAPTHLTIASLVVGLGGSAGIAVLAPRAAAGELPAWLVGLVGLVAWHVAYCLDCADGQLARVTGRASAAGARVDVLCDVAVHVGLVTAIATTAVAYAPDTRVWLVAVFAGTWMVNLVTSVLAGGPAAASLIRSGSILARTVKLTRDHGMLITLYGLAVAFVPEWTLWMMVGSCVTNGGFLALSIAQAARNSLHVADR